MRIYLCGQKHFGAAVLQALQGVQHSVRVVGVSAPAWSTSITTTGEPMPDRTRALAERLGIPWLVAGQLRAPLVQQLRVDLILAAHSHDFLGRPTRDAATLGAIGYHPSLLPLHRGRDAVRWTLKMRDRVTGGTVYWLDGNVDGGPILDQRHVLVHPAETVDSLWREKLAPLGVTMLLDAVRTIHRGTLPMRAQDEAYATWEPSWERPPVFRPELTQLGQGPVGYTVQVRGPLDQVD